MSRDLHAEQNIEDSLAATGSRNKSDRLRWFAKQGLGAFIHISLDVQLGMVISHNLINADADYLKHYFTELPETFCPDQFDARRWVRFLRSIGIRYVILTHKHHNGFCMWHTQTTPFHIGNTPYGRDMTRELCEACRAEGLAVGVYFSPDDFHVLWKQGKRIRRRDLEVLPKGNPELMALAKAQVTELLSNYGPIDMIFFDGDPTGLKELAWELQPDCVVTRGALPTPEQHLPEMGEDAEQLQGPWEACFTMGRQWQYRALHEAYKSPQTVIEMLIRTRAGGGNLLMNFGPKADGSLPPEQEDIMREVGLWLFINRDAIYDVVPYNVAQEGDVFYTASPDGSRVYAHLTQIDWPSLPYFIDPPELEVLPEPDLDEDGLHTAKARRLTWRLKAVSAGPDTHIRLLGQHANSVLPRAITETVVWEQQGDELQVSAWYTKRQYNDWFWDLPMVICIENPL